MVHTGMYTREAYRRVYTHHIHTQGGIQEGIPTIYTPRETTRLGIYPLYTPREATRLDIHPYTHPGRLPGWVYTTVNISREATRLGIHHCHTPWEGLRG